MQTATQNSVGRIDAALPVSEASPPRHIALGEVDLGGRERQYVNDALDRRRLTPGMYVRQFEQGFARAHDCAHAIACNSGTSALHVALTALKITHGWQEGDEVLVPAMTFIATSNIVLYSGLVPRFVEVCPRSYNIDPAQIEAQITPRTRAIIPVHLFGLPCEMDAIEAVARRHNLAILEDSCQTVLARQRGRSVGSFGAAACFSTYTAHTLVTGVGGLITTNDAALALLCRSLVAHGRDTAYLSIDDDDGVSDNQLRDIVARRFSFEHLGFSYRMSELEGALGLAQLERGAAIVGARRRNAARLSELLEPFEQFLQLPTQPEWSDHSFMMYPLVVRAPHSRDALVNYLERQGIETRYMFPLLSQPVYRRLFGNLEAQYPVAGELARRGFYIGCHQNLTGQDLDYVADVFTSYFSGEGGVA